MKRALLVVLLLSFASIPVHANVGVKSDPVLEAIHEEITRASTELSKKPTPPYFIAVEITQTQQLSIAAKDGNLNYTTPLTWRWADVDVRIGSSKLDSTHPLRQTGSGGRGGRPIPLTQDKNIIRHSLWQEIDARYLAAKNRWASVQAEAQVLVKEKPAEDLASAQPVESLLPVRDLVVDHSKWQATARTVSSVFAERGDVVHGTVTFSGNEDTHWFANTQGTHLRHHESRYRVDLSASALAEDGSQLTLHHAYDSHDPGDLPGVDELVIAARNLSKRVAALRDAPHDEPYIGPAILSDKAAGVFFHEILGHRLEGHRLKQVDSAQTFKNRMGKRILPSFISIVDDPSRRELAGTALRGYYRFDNEGVPTRTVHLVKGGILRGWLQSRSPVEPGQASNGHGRRQPGLEVVSRQGNLIVTADKSVSNAALRKELLRLLRKEKKEYGLMIEEIAGGFTFTDRFMPNAFKIEVTSARRVYVDGRADEQVRGLNLIGTPLEAFSNIVRAGERNDVFNGQCGAESGWVPVSAASPALLLSAVETQRKPKEQETPPLLPAPTAQ